MVYVLFYQALVLLSMLVALVKQITLFYGSIADVDAVVILPLYCVVADSDYM